MPVLREELFATPDKSGAPRRREGVQGNPLVSPPDMLQRMLVHPEGQPVDEGLKMNPMQKAQQEITLPETPPPSPENNRGEGKDASPGETLTPWEAIRRPDLMRETIQTGLLGEGAEHRCEHGHDWHLCHCSIGGDHDSSLFVSRIKLP